MAAPAAADSLLVLVDDPVHAATAVSDADPVVDRRPHEDSAVDHPIEERRPLSEAPDMAVTAAAPADSLTVATAQQVHPSTELAPPSVTEAPIWPPPPPSGPPPPIAAAVPALKPVEKAKPALPPRDKKAGHRSTDFAASLDAAGGADDHHGAAGGMVRSTAMLSDSDPMTAILKRKSFAPIANQALLISDTITHEAEALTVTVETHRRNMVGSDTFVEFVIKVTRGKNSWVCHVRFRSLCPFGIQLHFF
jgi:hypothetical protein